MDARYQPTSRRTRSALAVAALLVTVLGATAIEELADHYMRDGGPLARVEPAKQRPSAKVAVAALRAECRA